MPRKRQKKYTNTGKQSRDFKANPETARHYMVVAPAKLWISVQAKAKGRISIRALILGLLSRWVKGDLVHPPAAAPDMDELRDLSDSDDEPISTTIEDRRIAGPYSD